MIVQFKMYLFSLISSLSKVYVTNLWVVFRQNGSGLMMAPPSFMTGHLRGGVILKHDTTGSVKPEFDWHSCIYGDLHTLDLRCPTLGSILH